MNNKDLEFYIPTNINVREILLKERKGKRYLDCQIDKYHWFLDALYQRSTLNKSYDNADFIPMNDDYLVEKLGKRYVIDIKRIFRENGIIEDDGNYIEGEKSLGYRLTSDYQVRHYKILHDSESTFIKNLRTEKQRDIAKMDDITRYTYNQLKNLGIYRKDAEAYVENWYEKNLLVKNPSLLKKLKKQNLKRKKAENKARKKVRNISYIAFTYEQMLSNMRDSYLYQIRAIDEMLWLPKRDVKGFRIHSCLTNMWKELRQFLYVKSDPTVQLLSLDCSNSQPYTLVKILFEYFQTFAEMPADCRRYIDLVTTGKLYSYMCQLLGITDPDEIADFKTEMFAKVFYSKNQDGYYSPEAIKFREMFPFVYQIVMQEKKFNHKSLSIQMQRVETSAVIDHALADLMECYGDSVWFGSIHDSILCPAAYEEEVRDLMIQSYTKVVGIAPHIKPAEKVNVVKAVSQETGTDSSILPDMTPISDLKKHFEALFSSNEYLEQISRKKPAVSFKTAKKKFTTKGFEW